MEQLETPCLVIEVDRLERNIKKMAKSVKTTLRPHIKTHKCPIIAKKQLEVGNTVGITCAKVSEAEVMATAGFNNILIANQIIGPHKISRLFDLASENTVMVIVDNPINVKELAAAANARNIELPVLVEVDVGLKRTGVQPGKPALELARTVLASKGLVFEGLEFYEGNFGKIMDPAIQTRDLLEKEEVPVKTISSGGTCTYPITGNHPDITEIRPGNYVFNDTYYARVMQDFDCALTVLGTVISTPTPNRAVIDSGGKSMTQDNGIPSLINPKGWKLRWMNEEHGILERVDESSLSLGDKVEIVPSHACSTSNLYDNFCVVRKGMLEAIWDIPARGKIQ